MKDGHLRDMLRRCSTCQEFGSPHHKEEFRVVYEAGVLYEAISMYVMGPLGKGRLGKRYIACVIDHLTRWREARLVYSTKAHMAVETL